jgi:Helicase conserved C-terminal domain
MVLDRRFEMVRPREHSAQVPPEEREVLERAFNGKSQLVNTLVCTPTLEMGVDIGSLDSVLMRNVPPLPANYWQRAGRAGRRHRMAVNVTYARGTGHDRAYFKDPLKLLRGPITPPRFNLKNEPMVRKHVHATVLTALHRLASGRLSGPQHGEMPLEQSVRDEIDRVLGEALPQTIKTYLFDAANNVRAVPFDLAPLGALVAKHEPDVLASVAEVFARGWPLADRALVEPAALARYVGEMTQSLAGVIRRLETRLRWALEQLRRLDNVRQRKGTLDPEEDALRTRCDRLVKRLKGIQKRARSEAEGYDDTYSYAVLAAEGFLPGYGLDNGTVVGFHQATRYGVGARDWEIRRALPMALREDVPGNLIYANGHRFVPRFFHLQPVEPTLFQVDTENGAVSELGGGGDGAPAGLGAAAVLAVPICDVDLPHQSHITDEEDYRFQLPVTVYGHEQRRHGGGKVFTWGERTVTARSSVHFRLVNVGAAKKVLDGSLGFPVCLVCGQSRSPFASAAELQKFSEEHQLRCGRAVGSVGFYADVVADAIAVQGCETLTEAYSVAEALRQGAAEVLEIEESDLQILVIGRAGDSQHDVLLYDPMPGGSGLLDQLTGRPVAAGQLAGNAVALHQRLERDPMGIERRVGERGDGFGWDRGRGCGCAPERTPAAVTVSRSRSRSRSRDRFPIAR